MLNSVKKMDLSINRLDGITIKISECGYLIAMRVYDNDYRISIIVGNYNDRITFSFGKYPILQQFRYNHYVHL
jgi:hypothetical protein